MSSTRPLILSRAPVSSKAASALMCTQRCWPEGRTSRASAEPSWAGFMSAWKEARTAGRSSGWISGQAGVAASLKLMARPASSMNSGEHQKLRAFRSTSKTPARAAFSARPRRSALRCACRRAVVSASSWRLRASMSSTRPTTLRRRPSAASCCSAWACTQRISPDGSTMRKSMAGWRGPVQRATTSSISCRSSGWAMYQGSRAKRWKSTSTPTISWNSGENHWVLATKSNSETPARAAPSASLRRSALVWASRRACMRGVTSLAWTK